MSAIPPKMPTLESRVQVDLSCTLVLASGVEIPGVARHLAVSGMFVETRYPLSAIGHLTATFLLPMRGDSRIIEVACRIESNATQMSLGEFGIGLLFVNLDDKSQEWIKEYMQTRPQLH